MKKTRKSFYKHSKKPYDLRKSVRENLWALLSDLTVKEAEGEYDASLFKGPVVWLAQHGSMLGWLAVAVARAHLYSQRGIERKVGIIFHPVVLKSPIIKTFAKKFSGDQIIRNFKELKDCMDKGTIHEAGSCPESSNCCFLYDEPVAPFKFKSLVYYAIVSGYRVAILTHKGTEDWNFTLKFPFSLKLPNGIKGVHFPIPFARLSKLHFSLFEYKPSISSELMNSLSKEEQKKAVDLECELIKDVMLESYYSL